MCHRCSRLYTICPVCGSGDGRGESFLCLLPDPTIPDATADERSGSYFDHDLAADLSSVGAAAANRTFVFIGAFLGRGTPLYPHTYRAPEWPTYFFFEFDVTVLRNSQCSFFL